MKRTEKNPKITSGIVSNNYQISDDLFNKISTLVYDEIGVNLSSSKKAMVNSRLSKRLRALDFNDFSDYHQYLLNNKAELVQLYNLITTNVTKFFREEYHFDYLKDHLLPQLKNNNKKKIRIWSAACSSGEEAYSLAMVLDQFFDSDNLDIKILATDINTDVLNYAQQGIYTYQQIKNVPKSILKKYFKLGTGVNKNLFKVKERLKDMIIFTRLNLNQRIDYPIKTKLDFIFCRNVFIYFKGETKERIINKFYNHLQDQGYLFLGHSESISNLDRWRLIYRTTYQKLN